MLEIEMRVGPKGQVVIPKVFRKALKISPRSSVIFRMEGEKLIIEGPTQKTEKVFEEIAASGPSVKMYPHEAHDEELKERLG